MNSTLSKIIIFATGAAIGSVVTLELVKAKYKTFYEKRAEEDIESVREMYRKTYNRHEDSEGVTDNEEPSELNKANEIAKKFGYDLGEKEEVEEEADMDRPYVIDPDEYGESDYATETLDYYEGNGVLVDAFGEVVENPAEIVGEDFADHFGDYGDRDKDTVFIRNDAQGIDYEICRDYGSFSEDD